MTSLGFVVPEQIAQLAGDQDAFTISKEQFDIVDVDVLVWNVGSSPGAEAQITADPVYQSLPVAKAGRAVFVDDPTVSGALTWAPSSASRTPSRRWCRNWRMPPPNRPDAAVTRTGLRAG